MDTSWRFAKKVDPLYLYNLLEKQDHLGEALRILRELPPHHGVALRLRSRASWSGATNSQRFLEMPESLQVAAQPLFRFLEWRGELNKSILEMRYGTFAALLQYTPVSPENGASKAGQLFFANLQLVSI